MTVCYTAVAPSQTQQVVCATTCSTSCRARPAPVSHTVARAGHCHPSLCTFVPKVTSSKTRLVARVADVEGPFYETRDEKEFCTEAGCLEDLTVADVMASPPLSIGPERSIFEAMEILVDRGISGLPVVDADGEVIGQISGYDLLALDCTPGRLDDTIGMFPPVERCKTLFDGNRGAMWEEFRDLRDRMKRAKANTVGDAMRVDHATVRPGDSLLEAANAIVRRRLHRLMVVDENDKLVGVISRGDIMRATIQNFRFAMDMPAFHSGTDSE